MESFEGFSVLVSREKTMQCTRYVSSLTVTMGNHSMIDHFFVFEVPDTNVVMGVQWLYSLERVNYRLEEVRDRVCGPEQ